MVDFNKLRSQSQRPAPIDPLEIFRRMPKPQGINDLYTSQAEVLEAWFERKDERDTVVKLHTGGGKTLVGLLIAQSTLNDLKEPVLYLAPTTQLVKQTLEKAKSLGILAVPYTRGQPLHDDFVNGKAVMVASYKALFNGHSKFGVYARAPLLPTAPCRLPVRKAQRLPLSSVDTGSDVACFNASRRWCPSYTATLLPISSSRRLQTLVA